MRWIAIFSGVIAGGFFMAQDWTPLIRHTPHTDASYSDIKDSKKREFIRTLFETFESTNPRTEKYDDETNTKPSLDESRTHATQFDELSNRLVLGRCPVKKITVPTKWANGDAVDRQFRIFDIDHCKF